MYFTVTTWPAGPRADPVPVERVHQRTGRPVLTPLTHAVLDLGPPPPCPDAFNLAAYVLQHAARLGEKTALGLVSDQAAEHWCFARLEAAVRGTGTGLRAAGLQPGALVLIRLGNSVDFPIAYLGAIAAGLVPVPTSAQLTTPEVARMMAALSPAAVIRDPKVASAEHPHEISLDALRAMRDLPPVDWALGDPNRLAYVVFTSGTSGQARAVAHAHRAVWARRMMGPGWTGLRADDRLCHAGALNWTYTLGTGMLDPWAEGAQSLILAPGTDLQALPDILRQHRATLFAAAPGVYRRMLQGVDSLALPDLRHGVSAGEKMPPPLKERWRQATGKDVYEAFGMSECSTFISGCPAHPATGNAIGRPQPGRHVAVLGPDGPVPVNQPGEIAVHHSDPGLMLEYLNAAEATRARFRGPWFLTGDHGQMDETGQITYLARNDDMMNPGGFRVSPLDVEATLATFPGLTGVGVTEVEVKPDVRVIAAFYTAPSPLDETALRVYAEQRLAAYKQPRLYIHMPALPTSANGKLLRRSLRAAYEDRSHDTDNR